MASDTLEYHYDTVVYITDTVGGQGLQGSGVLISPDEVLTASHVVYSSTYGAASDITVAPGYNAGSEPFGTAAGTTTHYYQIQDAGDMISTQQSQFDFAVRHLSNSFTSLGTMGLEPNFPGGIVTVTGYPGSLNGQIENSQQDVTVNPSYTVFDGTTIGKGSSGGPVWISGSNDGPYVVGVISSGEAGVGSPGFFAQITTAAFNQIEAWVAQDNSDGSGLSVLDTTTGQSVSAVAQPYTEPVSGLINEYINITSDSLNISVSTPNWFIHSGSGNDAIAVNGGTNVLDGGTGSNFLTGGGGTDTFFVDERGPTADTWSTVNNFHSGDATTIWGVTPNDFALSWADGQGAAGYTGLTLHATSSGVPTASLTLAGFSSADLTDGKLTVSFGTTAATGGVPGSPYMYVQAS